MTYLDESYPPDVLYAPGPFALNSLAPASVVVPGGVVVSANGTSFTPFTRVYVDGVAVPTTYVGSGVVRFTAPNRGAPTTAQVTVENGASVSGARTLTYTASGGTQGTFTPVGKSIDGVKNYVMGLGDSDDEDVQQEVQRILDIERANANRTTLVSWLDQRLGIE